MATKIHMDKQGILSKSEFSSLRKKVFDYNPSESLKSVNRDEAIFAALQAAELYRGVFFLHHLVNAKRVPDSMQIVAQSIDALHFAMRWIFEQCFFASSIVLPPPSHNSQTAIKELLERACIYTPVDQLLDTVSAGMAQAESLPDGTISISQPDVESSRAYYANGRLTRNSGLAKARPEKFREPNPKALDKAINGAVIKGPRDYSISSAGFAELMCNYDAERANFWSYDSTDSLGNYTFGDLRRFWMCLYTICMLHIAICSKLKAHSILFKTRSQWTEEIANRSGLPQSVVSAILDDLTYVKDLYLKGGAQAEIASQPFFPVGTNQLALSNILVISTDPERNIWQLVSIKRQSVFSTVESRKEKLWAESTLIPWLLGLGYEAWSHIKFTESELISGDVDLFVLDRKSNFALAIELKWLKGQGDLKDLQHINKTLTYAVDQAMKSIEWLKTIPQQVLQRTGLTANELRNLRIEPLVVSRNSLGGPSVHGLAVPIINEFLMQLTLDEPHRRSLEDLLKIARNRTYLPKLGEHFDLRSWDESYAGITFRSHLNPATLREWDYLVDMGFDDSPKATTAS